MIPRARVLIPILIITTTLPVWAGEYILVKPGASQTLRGTTTLGESTSETIKSVTVLPAGAVKHAPPGSILVHTRVTLKGKERDRIICLERRDDGYYCVATAKAPGKKARPLDEPILERPIPLVQGAGWTMVQEEQGEVHLSWTVRSIDPETGVAHLEAEGTTRFMGLEVPVTKEIWLRPSGEVVREISRQTILGQQTVTILEP